MAKKDASHGAASKRRKHKTEQGETHEHDHEPGVLFHTKLDFTVAELLHRVEVRSGHLIETEIGPAADLFPAMGWFDLERKPHLAAATTKPEMVPLAIELVRLDMRAGRGEQTLPPYEIQHPGNSAVARRLYRMIELEVVLSRVEGLGVPARSWLIERHEKGLLEALAKGTYRPDLDEGARVRHAVLDALELWTAEIGEFDSRRRSTRVAEASAEIGRMLAASTKAISNFRPFDKDKIDGAYYLAIPFLLESRRPPVHA